MDHDRSIREMKYTSLTSRTVHSKAVFADFKAGGDSLRADFVEFIGACRAFRRRLMLWVAGTRCMPPSSRAIM